MVLCQEFHVMPDGGGVLDQDPQWIERMEIVASAQRKRAELDRVKGKGRP